MVVLVAEDTTTGVMVLVVLNLLSTFGEDWLCLLVLVYDTVVVVVATGLGDLPEGEYDESCPK